MTRAAHFDPRAEEQLEPPPLDDTVHHVWIWWLELHLSRIRNADVVQPITWQDIDVFNRLFALDMLPEEVALVREVESAFMFHQYEKSHPGSESIEG